MFKECGFVFVSVKDSKLLVYANRDSALACHCCKERLPIAGLIRPRRHGQANGARQDHNQGHDVRVRPLQLQTPTW